MSGIRAGQYAGYWRRRNGQLVKLVPLGRGEYRVQYGPHKPVRMRTFEIKQLIAMGLWHREDSAQ